MWSYVWRMLQRQLGKSALASGGFALIACALVLLSATTQTAVVQGNQIISQSWHPTYAARVAARRAADAADGHA